MNSPKSLKIFIHALDGAGHMNACIGLAQALASRGHRIYFLVNSSFGSQYAQFGFEQILLDSEIWKSENVETTDAPKENPFKVFVKLIRESGLLSNKNSLEKMKVWASEELIDQFYDALVKYDPQMEQAIEREKPDLVILDQILIPPAVQKAGIPWILMLSANPLVFYGSDQLPPPASGYPTNGDRTKWAEFRKTTSFSDLIPPRQEKLNREFNCELENANRNPNVAYLLSKYLNIYQYPEELDYHDIITIPEHFVRVDAFCREMPEPFKLPENFKIDQKVEKLVYLSLGSMGSIDVELMKRIVEILGKTKQKYIISKGPLHDQYDLPDNCWGEAYLPQTAVLPLVDLVITHGGNNTVTESLTHGKPMIVMPLFGDQFDNAQRIQEKGYGLRLELYDFTEKQLIDSIDDLLKDAELQKRCKLAAAQIEKRKSKVKICQQIEHTVKQFQEKQIF